MGAIIRLGEVKQPAGSPHLMMEHPHSPSHYLQINFTCEEAKEKEKKYCLDVVSIVVLLREDIK